MHRTFLGNLCPGRHDSYSNKQKAGDRMPNNEKELNCYLLDQLELIERLEIVAKNGDNDEVLKQLMLEKKFVERKLYQKPPLANEQP